jgi:diguanylate cyclase (GGDEF)-like protein
LIETNKPSAKIVAEKIRRLVEEHTFAYEEAQPNGKITISMGVATFPEDGKDFNDLVSVADQRLYKAKQAGRNAIFAES